MPVKWWKTSASLAESLFIVPTLSSTESTSTESTAGNRLLSHPVPITKLRIFTELGSAARNMVRISLARAAPGPELVDPADVESVGFHRFC